MKVVFCLKLSFCLILMETYHPRMTEATEITGRTEANNSSADVTQLKQLNAKLQEQLIKLANLYKSLKFLRQISTKFMLEINAISDRNKMTSIELHNIPALSLDEQYEIVEDLSRKLFGNFDDRDITGVRTFFTHKNLQRRKLIIQFRSLQVKYKWFSRFVEISKSMGFTYIKHFPGFNLTLSDGGSVIKGLTIHDHISKYKASVLKVAQGNLSKYKYVKVFINNTEIYVDRKIDTDTFVRYLLRDFDDVKEVKNLLIRENVPLAFSQWARDDITLDQRYVFTKNHEMHLSRTYQNRVQMYSKTSRKRIVKH